MDFEDAEAQVDREIAEERRLRAEWRAERLRFKQKLFGADDALDWQAPPEIEDFDALLCQHAAQLSNAVRMTMSRVLSDDIEAEAQNKAANALTRLIQTNIAIAKTVAPVAPIRKSKTVHGVPKAKEPQD
ncbi:MAG TPA: hypothetical protein VII56_03760 [Rhizomicrobium sp.]